MFNLNYLVKTYNLTDFEKQIIAHEGMRLTPYKDSVGKITIGIGWNIDDVPMRESEAITRMRNDLAEVKMQAEKLLFFSKLNLVRQNVIIEMIFNLGHSKFMQFKNMIVALQNYNYELAAKEMLTSKWATQVKSRAVTLAKQMETGKM